MLNRHAIGEVRECGDRGVCVMHIAWGRCRLGPCRCGDRRDGWCAWGSRDRCLFGGAGGAPGRISVRGFCLLRSGNSARQQTGRDVFDGLRVYPDNFDITVFAREAAALKAPVGAPVSVQFYNANCYASPAIRMFIRYAKRGATAQEPTRDATIAPAVTIPSTPADQYSPVLSFRMPDVGQASRNGYFSVVVDFTGTLQRCDVTSVVLGDFVITGGASPCATVNGTRSLSSAKVSASECPLVVTVTPLRGTSGLRLKDVGPAFMDGTYTCFSGCIGLLVHVTNPGDGNKPVENATVVASVPAITRGLPRILPRALRPADTSATSCTTTGAGRCRITTSGPG